MGKHLLRLVVLLGLVLPLPAEALTEREKAIVDTFARQAEAVGEASMRFLRSHAEESYRSITYGQLVQEDYLGSTYCDAAPRENERGYVTCGGVERTVRSDSGVPPFFHAQNKRALVFLFPYKELSSSVVEYFYLRGNHSSLVPKLIVRDGRSYLVYVQLLLPATTRRPAT